MGSSSAVGIALVKLGQKSGVGGVSLTVLQTYEPLKNWEIKVITRIDDEFLEINFTDGSNGVQVRCGGLDRET